MVTMLDYAALSAIIYNDVRKQANKILPAPPTGWSEVLYESNPGFTGIKGVRDQRGQCHLTF